MNNHLVSVGKSTGRIFEGVVPHTYCFVPQEYIAGEGENISVIETDYAAARWDLRNMRSNLTVEGGERLFPDAHRPVENVEAEPVKVFLGRLRRSRAGQS